MLAPILLLAAAVAQAEPAIPAPRGEPRSTVDPATPDVLARDAGPLLTLQEALREAESKNLDLRQVRARLDQARQPVSRAWSGQLPQVRATGTAQHNDAGAAIPAGVFGPERIVIQSQNQLVGQVEATQALFAPSLWYGISAARSGTDAAEQSSESARRDILFGVTETYYGAVAFRKAISVAVRQLAIAREHERDARVRYEAGAVPKVALLRAEIDRARREQDVIRGNNAYESAKVALSTLLDRADTRFEVDVPPAPEVPANGDALEKEALRARPEVRAAEANVAAQQATRKSAVARYVPTVGAFGQYRISNAGGFTGSEDTWAIGLSAAWDIFDGGLREADIRDASARIVEAEAALRGAENRVRDEIRRARLDLDSAVANRRKALEEAELARENQRLVEVNFKEGAATYLEVSDANGALVEAELSIIRESLAASLAAVRLLRASGQFAAAR
jgi:outer membrane protein TolC